MDETPQKRGFFREGTTRRERAAVWAAIGAWIGFLCAGAAIITLTYLDLFPSPSKEATVNSAILYGSMAAGAGTGAAFGFRRNP